jgi:NitT/TauT family transport system permease protein
VVARDHIKSTALFVSAEKPGGLPPRKTRSARRNRLIPLLFVAVGLFAWELLVTSWSIPQYLLPAPSAVLGEFARRPWGLLYDFYITGAEAVAGFAIAVIFASTVAVIFSHSRVIYDSVMPYLIGLKAVPLIAIAPLLVIWLGNGFISKAVMAATICFFPIVVNLTRGLREVPEEQMDLMKSLGASGTQIFFTVRVPNSLPFLFAALKITSTLSVVGAVVAEFSGANQGVGYAIMVAALRTDTPLMFTGIILASLLGMLLYYTIEFIEPFFVKWEMKDE